jgi:hypothetical protein
LAEQELEEFKRNMNANHAATGNWPIFQLVIRANGGGSSPPIEVGCGYDHITSYHYQ